MTVDAFGTLVGLRGPVERLSAALAERGASREREVVARAFAAEAAYYTAHSYKGRDARTLASLRRDCAEIFLADLRADLDPGDFAPALVASLEFSLLPGTEDALDVLRSAGLALACVANWDFTLPSHLARLGVSDRFHAIVTSAEAGVQKPDPVIFRLALARIGVSPGRALHVGDSESDREGARRAALAFEPAPLATLPKRLGLEQ